MSDQKLKLEVNDLKISFRTNNGRVQAVRDISFDLYEGETLAIVGESGSGKSVTSRAIMGILAPNAIVESGEILYDGKDLMQITEEEFHSLRGDKISMVFQDPLSSLNPIVKIGKQLTEAMILKNRLSIRENRKKLNRAFKILGKNIDEALNAKEDTSVKQKINKTKSGMIERETKEEGTQEQKPETELAEGSTEEEDEEDPADQDAAEEDDVQAEKTPEEGAEENYQVIGTESAEGS